MDCTLGDQTGKELLQSEVQSSGQETVLPSTCKYPWQKFLGSFDAVDREKPVTKFLFNVQLTVMQFCIVIVQFV